MVKIRIANHLKGMYYSYFESCSPFAHIVRYLVVFNVFKIDSSRYDVNDLMFVELSVIIVPKNYTTTEWTLFEARKFLIQLNASSLDIAVNATPESKRKPTAIALCAPDNRTNFDFYFGREMHLLFFQIFTWNLSSKCHWFVVFSFFFFHFICLATTHNWYSRGAKDIFATEYVHCMSHTFSVSLDHAVSHSLFFHLVYFSWHLLSHALIPLLFVVVAVCTIVELSIFCHFH